MAEIRWSQAMMNAWQYAIKGVFDGMSGAAGLQQYRDGGGSIRTQDWYRLTRWGQDVEQSQVTAEDGIRWATMPESVYVDSGFRFREEYKMIAQLRFTNPQTGQRDIMYVSALDNVSKSLDMWDSHLDVILSNYGLSMDMETVTVTKRLFLHSG